MEKEPRKALGRGLASLISPVVSTVIKEGERGETLKKIPIDLIFANREQPRLTFDNEGIQELALSIKKDGILQPIVVAPAAEGRFEVIAGERRLRAARMAGLTEVPVTIRTASGEKMLELALVENIQREDLNPMEEARGYQSLVDRFQLSHADIAERVGKSREHVANASRLLKLPKQVQEDVAAGRISAGHARALLALPSLQDQLYFHERILNESLSVRDVERMVRERGGVRKIIRRNSKKNLSPQIKLLLDDLEKAVGTKVRLQMSAVEGRGAISIDYYSWQDLDRIYRKIIA